MVFFRKYILHILIIALLFVVVNPLKEKFQKYDTSLYNLRVKGVSSSNHYSQWIKKDTGKFVIHSGKKKVINAKFYIQKRSHMFIHIEMNKKASIKCYIFKNKNRLLKQTVRQSKPLDFDLVLNKGDKLEIEISKNHSVTHDWATITLKNKNDFYFVEYAILLMVWILLFILLTKSGFTLIFYTSYALFLLITYAERMTFKALSFDAILTYMGFIFALTFIVVFLYQYVKRWMIPFVLSFVLYGSLFFIFLLYTLYLYNFNEPLNQDILYAIFQSNSHEASAYVGDFVSIWYVALFIMVFCLVGVALYLQGKRDVKRIELFHLLFYICIFSAMFMFKFETLNILSFTQRKAERYAEELQIFNSLKDKIKTGEIAFKASKKEKDETYVVILGESLNKQHMGLYGYFRETTPFLSKLYKDGQILKFTNTYANYINTSKAWSFGLTQANQYNGKSFYTSLNILNVLKKASVESYWITNQALYGGWDNIISVMAQQADHVMGMNYSIGKRVHTEHYDEVLIGKVKKVLSRKSDRTRVIFVHLMGSHSSYENRYPKEFNHFKDLNDSHMTNEINEYDNSVLYNDFIVSELVKEVQHTSGVRAVIYMPDHAEDVIHKKGHHSGRRFTFDMVQIPFVCWFSKEYKIKYKSTYEAFQSNQNRLFSNDMFYDTLLGLLHIDTTAMKSKYDLSSKMYKLKDEDALTQHGKRHYNAIKNRFFKKNSEIDAKNLN